VTALLEVDGLVKEFPGRSGTVRAVDDVSLSVAVGETLGLVGESGSGKSTIARLVVRLLEPSQGAIRIDGDDVSHLSRRALRSLRRRVQIVFQNPYSSLDPRMTARAIVGEPLKIAWRSWGSGPSTRAAIHTSCRVGSASGSASPGRWPFNPSCWCSTNR
jgi:oligopeptide transport system ATP-binding protein